VAHPSVLAVPILGRKTDKETRSRGGQVLDLRIKDFIPRFEICYLRSTEVTLTWAFFTILFLKKCITPKHLNSAKGVSMARQPGIINADDLLPLFSVQAPHRRFSRKSASH
jgi:hypothetical protein